MQRKDSISKEFIKTKSLLLDMNKCIEVDIFYRHIYDNYVGKREGILVNQSMISISLPLVVSFYCELLHINLFSPEKAIYLVDMNSNFICNSFVL